MIKNARVARCRSRFPLPVILYKGRYVCRSATLSGGAEIYGRSSYDFLFANNETTANEATIEEGTKETEMPKDRQSISDLCDKVRSQDINLLKMLNVGTIIDFMVEKKKVKFGMKWVFSFDYLLLLFLFVFYIHEKINDDRYFSSNWNDLLQVV